MPPAPLPADESHRLARLHATGILDTQAEESFDTLAQCAAELTGCPIAVISLLDARREWFKAVHGWDDLPVREIPRAISFCSHTLHQPTPFEVGDAARDTRFAHNPFVTGMPHIRAYAAAPLVVDGVHLGALCVIDTRPHTLSDKERAALVRLAHVASELLHHQRSTPPAATDDDERARLLDFARASGDWMWETDAELRHTWVSATFEAVTGVSPRDMKGQALEDSPLLDSLGQPLGESRRLHALLQRHQPITRVISDKLTPRGTLQVSYSAVPVFNAQGQFAGYRGTARDVSTHIAAERRTHAQAELLRKLSSQVPGVIFQLWLQPDGQVRCTYASDASREVFGLEPPRNGDSGDATVVCRMLHPDDEPDFIPSLQAASRALQPWQREFRIVRDGRPRWIEARAVPEQHPAGGTLWHGFCSDVTPRKEIELALRSSEARWGLAAEAAGIGIAEVDLDSGRMSFDARACANHGLKFPQPDYHLADWFGAMHPDDRAGMQVRLDAALATGGMLETRYRLQRPDGTQSVLEVFARTLGDAQHPVGMVGTCRDVTQQTLHEQLRSDKEAAERASRAKSEFLSRVSHELRTPLNGILGFAQLMAIDQAHPLATEQSRRLDSVLRASRHLLELINDMLNLARIEQEDFSLQRSPVNLAETLQTCFSLIQPLADSAGVRLAAPPQRAHWALGDTRAVEQVLLNLLSNAIKYNRPGGAVCVTLSRGDEHVHVAVSDEGEGLSEAQQAHLFQPFNRLGAEQRRVEGSGLGLVIARELAASMSGELKVMSAIGKGSTFTLKLPACAAPGGARPPRSDPHAPAPPEPPTARRQVLYVEDEPLNVLLMQEVFRVRPQWELRIATDGQSGLDAARTQQHDLLLIDMNLPDMSGLELIRALRADPRTARLQCIALSADAMQSQVDTALAAGFDGYWTKPINVALMLEGLGQALEK